MNKSEVVTLYSELISHPIKNFNFTDNTQVSDYIDIEQAILKNNISYALKLWNSRYSLRQEFIADTVRMKIAFAQDEYKLVQDFQVYWQTTLDKFELDVLTELYLGFFYQIIGKTYIELFEYEIGAHKLGKADYFFLNINFISGQYLVQQDISSAFIQLGAYGDARYHLREILRREFLIKPEELSNNYYQQAQILEKDGLPQKALSMYKKILKVCDVESTLFRQSKYKIEKLKKQQI